jgi:hypothetical protein
MELSVLSPCLLLSTLDGPGRPACERASAALVRLIATNTVTANSIMSATGHIVSSGWKAVHPDKGRLAAGLLTPNSKLSVFFRVCSSVQGNMSRG